MDIQEMTLAQLKEHIAEAEQIREALNMRSIEDIVSSNDGHWKLDTFYFIRTVTHHICGKLVRVTDKDLVLEQAAWVADDGRFNKALTTGEVNEVEPFPDGQVIVGRGALIDAAIWANAPLRAVK